MELFPAQPNLSLQISPPNNKPSSSLGEENMDLGFWKRALEQSNSSSKGGIIIDHSLANPTAPSASNPTYHDLLSMKPIRGIPLYHTSPNYSFPLPNRHYNNNHHRHQRAQYSSSSSTSTTSFGIQTMSSSRFLSSYPPPKRTMRAPRMRWTTMLHARFIHAVELLGGHERATPKSVLELMDVKDLTLAHVKSHLQMYRTVKTVDRQPTSPGQNDPIEISEDNLFDIRGPESMAQNGKLQGHISTNHYGLWSNSSRGNWFHDKPKDFNTGTVVNDSSMVNLEFTLGRPL